MRAVNASLPRIRQILAAVVGNALEWYDFSIFGFLSVVIARLFFPSSSETAGLLLTFATFGVGFFMRPVGAIAIGLYADRKGRKAALQLVILLMTIAVALVVCTPTYATIGIGAPLLIVLARLLQGFAAGGEFSSATSFLVESGPPAQRGYYGSLQMVGQGVSALLGALAGTLVTRALAPEQLDAWGWRLPFAVGLLVGPVGLYIRRHVEETPEFLKIAQQTTNRVRIGALLREHTRAVIASFLLIVCTTTCFYVVLLYMPAYAKTQLGLPLGEAFTAQIIALAWLVLLTPLFGYLSDIVGRRPIIVVGAIGYFLLPYPLFSMALAQPGFYRLLALQVSMCTVVAMLFGVMSTALAEQFPTAVRSTGMGIAYNFAVMIFGGFAPVIVTWLIQASGSPVAPSFYIMFGALAGLASSFLLVEPAPATLGAGAEASA